MCDRIDFLKHLPNLLKPTGGLVIIGDGPLGKSPTSDGFLNIKSELRSWLKERYPSNFCVERFTPKTTYGSHEQCLEKFQLNFEKTYFEFERLWSKDEAIGHLLSTCIVPDELLITERESIVEFLEQLLASFESTSGTLLEKACMEVILVK